MEKKLKQESDSSVTTIVITTKLGVLNIECEKILDDCVQTFSCFLDENVIREGNNAADLTLNTAKVLLINQLARTVSDLAQLCETQTKEL